MYTDAHRSLVKSFQEICYWNYEIRSALRVMCRYSYITIDHHMYRVIVAMKEYWMLQVQKLFDQKYSFGDKSRPNLVLDYVIDEVPWPDEVKRKLQELKVKMEPFASSLKDVRNKVIAHHDLKTLTERKDEWLGAYAPDDEERFYESLLDFLNVVQAAIDSSPPLEWPHFAHSDAEQFMAVLERNGCARVDNA